MMRRKINTRKLWSEESIHTVYQNIGWIVQFTSFESLQINCDVDIIRKMFHFLLKLILEYLILVYSAVKKLENWKLIFWALIPFRKRFLKHTLECGVIALASDPDMYENWRIHRSAEQFLIKPMVLFRSRIKIKLIVNWLTLMLEHGIYFNKNTLFKPDIIEVMKKCVKNVENKEITEEELTKEM